MEMLFYSAIALTAVLLLLVYLYTRPKARIRRYEDAAESYLATYRDAEALATGDDKLPKDVELMREFYHRLKEKHEALITDVVQIAGEWAEYSKRKAESDGSIEIQASEANEPASANIRELRVLSAQITESRNVAAEIEDHFGQMLGPRQFSRLTEARRRRFAERDPGGRQPTGSDPPLARATTAG